MSASLIHFVLVHHGEAARPGSPRVLHFNVEGAAGESLSTNSPVHLLVLDARRMNAACLKAAFAEIRHLRSAPGFKHGVLVCNTPALPVVQEAMRAGLRDIIHEPLTARQLVQLLRAATPGNHACARQLAALAAIVRTLAAADRAAASPSASLARREYALVQRADQLAHMETRLALERAALEDREQKLRASARRLERDYAALQVETDTVRPKPPAPAPVSTATPFSASPFATDLQAVAAQLAERATALDIRERMLQEMERLLTAQLADAGALAV
jgi:DNA-binding NarL/FixJ family response regulator